MKRIQLYSALWLPLLALALLVAASVTGRLASPLWWLLGIPVVMLPALAVRRAADWRTADPVAGDVLYYFRAPY